MSTHRHPQYERELAALRADVRDLRELLRVMAVLQADIRRLLGLPSEPPEGEG